jgi:indole-3-glycerol phosphate synthase
MATILDRIVTHKLVEIATAKEQLPEATLEQLVGSSPLVRDFAAALTEPAGVQIIAEIKRASPSAGQLSAARDITAIAQTYASYGAACISVLTDHQFFQGSLHDLASVRQVTEVPLLRKDFILDRYQLLEARAAGADAVLLIAEILSDSQLHEFVRESHQLGMSTLVECYEPPNLARAVATGCRLIGINNRDLHTFNTSVQHTLTLAHQVPADRCLISESGITCRADVERLHAAGVKAVLVGETLMRATTIADKLTELCGVGR